MSEEIFPKPPHEPEAVTERMEATEIDFYTRRHTKPQKKAEITAEQRPIVTIIEECWYYLLALSLFACAVGSIIALIVEGKK
jgi:hypothetical protein